MTNDAIEFAEVPPAGWDERLRVFRAGDEVDTFALRTQRAVIVIDTMATPQHGQQLLAAITPDLEGRELIVINTHADWDHCWGNAAFIAAGAPQHVTIIGSSGTYARMTSDEERAYLATRQAKEPRFAPVTLVPPTVHFAGRAVIECGDLSLELIPTPGHTADHIAIWIPALSLLLAGDAAEQPFPHVDTAATLPTLRHSLTAMAALNPAMVIPCHGGTTDPALLTRNSAYFDTIEARVRTAIAARSLADDWRERADIADHIGYPFTDAVRDVGSNPDTVPTFYRSFHPSAVRTMIAWVIGSESGSIAG